MCRYVCVRVCAIVRCIYGVHSKAVLTLKAGQPPRNDLSRCQRNSTVLTDPTHAYDDKVTDLVHRCEGVQACQLWPCDGHHFGGGIQLHGTGAQGNHTMGQRQVPVLQALQIPVCVHTCVCVYSVCVCLSERHPFTSVCLLKRALVEAACG